MDIGEGTLSENEHGEILLSPGFCKTVYTFDNCIEKKYPDTNNISTKENTWFPERAILCSMNEIVKNINSVITENVMLLKVFIHRLILLLTKIIL